MRGERKQVSQVGMEGVREIRHTSGAGMLPLGPDAEVYTALQTHSRTLIFTYKKL